MPVLDFTSALYLGFHHPKASLRPWEQLTTGRPAALEEPPGARAVAHKLAALVGCEGAVLVPSTLHVFWDLFGMLAHARVIIYMDAGIYPIAQWGIERAVARGVPVRPFPHHDAEALRWRLRHDAPRRARPLVVTDSFCPGCGKPAPLAAYLESARTYGGQLILDDTQALGIFGHAPGPQAPYGEGGGGALRRSNISGPDILVGSSLAKGFGVPVAVLAGSEVMMHRFMRQSETRTHSSPPSMAVIHAAENALAVNQECGDTLRLRLAQRVRHFREHLTDTGFLVTGGLFPVQTLTPLPALHAGVLHERILRLGVRTVLRRSHNGNGPRISFLLTVRHRLQDIDRAVEALTYATRAIDAPAHGLGGQS
jgi:8-amino-7-oxononanoate synthase